MTKSHYPAATEPSQPSHPLEAALAQHVSRRSFLYSLGALALSGCGGAAGGLASSAPAPRAAGAPTPFVHPGLLHTDADFARMRQKYTASPWSGSWNLLISSDFAKSTYAYAGQTWVYRGDDGVHTQNYARLYKDVAAAYACALRWKISGDATYANTAVNIMNDWSAKLAGIGGTSDALLAAGLYGYEFANAGEIMRTYSGWAAADQDRFKGMMRNIFYPMCHDFLIRHNNTEITHYWANWDLCAMCAILAIGVLCDDGGLFDEAVDYFKNGAGNGAAAQAVYYLHPGYLGQWQESGRDQGHATLGIALMGAFCEMAWNQGVDLYGYDNNRFLAGAEYVAKSNLKDAAGAYYTVPYVRYTNSLETDPVFDIEAVGNLRPCWALVYNHYVNRKGLAAPYSKKFALQMEPEGGSGYYNKDSGGFDQLGYGTLTFRLDPIASGAVPSGLTGFVCAGAVVLSWWGSAYATSYTVKRAMVSGGPYTTLQTGITDLLTYTDTTAPAGNCYYVVTAIMPSGESGPSNEAVVVTGTQLHTYLPFDASSGTTAVDASGNGHTGILNGGAGWVAGRKNNAVSLNGSTGYVSLPSDLLVDVGDFTVATWVYWNASRDRERVFDLGSGTGRYIYLCPRTTAGVARFTMTVNGLYGEQGINHTAPLPTGQWVHVAFTLSGSTGTLYINGAPAGSNAEMVQAPFRLQSTNRNWLGRAQNTTAPYFNGKIDEFRIYRGALDAAAVLALYNS